MRVPSATYRLQFNEKFRLTDALDLVPYLHGLGISHIYASPLFAACPHSTHGYDVCDFNRLNPEIGTEEDLKKLVTALHERQMGLVVDIVPNHMGIGTPQNVWWWDVLRHGEKSKYARCFDIEWTPQDENLHGKVLVPVLGATYESVLNRGELKVVNDNNTFILAYHSHQFPLTPGTTRALPTDPKKLDEFNADFVALNQLIQRQHYLLDYFEVGDDKLNYRRFFAISSLAAVRVEEKKVFNSVHALIRRWYKAGWIDGLRVDHPDGLRDPAAYFQQLRALAPKAWIVIEKILEPDEFLPMDWPVAGTTGYEFLNRLNGVLVDPAAEPGFNEFYREFTGDKADYASTARQKKRAVLKTLFRTELNRLASLLAKIAARDSSAKSFATADLEEALIAVIACFPVYRSYISENVAPSAVDAANIQAAVYLAGKECKTVVPSIFTFIQDLLLNPRRRKVALNFIVRFQQLCGPVMAKGVEDTIFYCFNRFISLNEVGGDPGRFGTSVEEFHKLSMLQSGRPDSQLTTSTHDTKRAEDVRARLNVLSEMPDEWLQTVRRWSVMNACHRRGDRPDRNAEYLFYQTLVGAWPISTERILAFAEKAARESKEHTTWIKPDKEYEEALKNFISESLSDPEFKTDLERFVNKIAHASAINSLSQTLIKLTAPGVPDIYQGCELWDFSLVDPDNRRPVDFKLRQELFKQTRTLSAEKAWHERASGLPKLWLIEKVLNFRLKLPAFSGYDYEPLFARGTKSGHMLAFKRGPNVVVIIPRWSYKLNNDWGDTTLELPPGDWHNLFTGDQFKGILPLENFFKKFPVALLEGKGVD